jgi:hypothetical protein
MAPFGHIFGHQFQPPDADVSNRAPIKLQVRPHVALRLRPFRRPERHYECVALPAELLGPTSTFVLTEVLNTGLVNSLVNFPGADEECVGRSRRGGKGSGKWRLRVFLGRDANRKGQWVSRNFTGGKRAAQTALNKLIADVERGQVKSHAGSVGELLDRWLDDTEPHRSKYTMKSHRRCVEKDIKPAIGSIRLDRLTARQLDAFYRSLLDRGLSPATVRRHHSIISAALGRAVKWDMIGANPAEKASPPRLPGAQPRHPLSRTSSGCLPPPRRKTPCWPRPSPWPPPPVLVGESSALSDGRTSTGNAVAPASTSP